MLRYHIPWISCKVCRWMDSCRHEFVEFVDNEVTDLQIATLCSSARRSVCHNRLPGETSCDSSWTILLPKLFWSLALLAFSEVGGVCGWSCGSTHPPQNMVGCDSRGKIQVDSSVKNGRSGERRSLPWGNAILLPRICPHLFPGDWEGFCWQGFQSSQLQREGAASLFLFFEISTTHCPCISWQVTMKQCPEATFSSFVVIMAVVLCGCEGGWVWWVHDKGGSFCKLEMHPSQFSTWKQVIHRGAGIYAETERLQPSQNYGPVTHNLRSQLQIQSEWNRRGRGHRSPWQMMHGPWPEFVKHVAGIERIDASFRCVSHSFLTKFVA